MEIEVEVKNVYGNEMIYPVCEKAKLFCDLAGQKTFTAKTLRIVSLLGYEVKQVLGKSEKLQNNVIKA